MLRIRVFFLFLWSTKSTNAFHQQQDLHVLLSLARLPRFEFMPTCFVRFSSVYFFFLFLSFRYMCVMDCSTNVLMPLSTNHSSNCLSFNSFSFCLRSRVADVINLFRERQIWERKLWNMKMNHLISLIFQCHTHTKSSPSSRFVSPRQRCYSQKVHNAVRKLK